MAPPPAPMTSNVGRDLMGKDGQGGPNPSEVQSLMGNYGLAQQGGGDGVAPALPPVSPAPAAAQTLLHSAQFGGAVT